MPRFPTLPACAEPCRQPAARESEVRSPETAWDRSRPGEGRGSHCPQDSISASRKCLHQTCAAVTPGVGKKHLPPTGVSATPPGACIGNTPSTSPPFHIFATVNRFTLMLTEIFTPQRETLSTEKYANPAWRRLAPSTLPPERFRKSYSAHALHASRRKKAPHWKRRWLIKILSFS